MKPDKNIFENMPPSAKDTHQRIEKQLQLMINDKSESPLETPFLNLYTGFLSLFDEYLYKFINEVNAPVCCKKGCAYCCYHWVEDVYSFEAEIIADYIKKNQADAATEIIETCRKDIEQYTVIEKIVEEKLESEDEYSEENFDSIDITLSCFYQMKRPCPFLNDRNECSIYPVRPLTCRKYISLSDPSACEPEIISDENTATCLLDIEEKEIVKLEKLHYRFEKFSGDTGFRSLVVKYLEE